MQTVPSSTTSMPVTTGPTDATTTTSGSSTTSSSSTTSASSSSSTTTAPRAASCADSLTRMADMASSEMPASIMVNGATVMVDCTMAPGPACISSLDVYNTDGNQFVIAQVPSTFDCINNQISFMGVVFDGIFCVYAC
ncbi:unnamed protein product [Caenorhabditis auriculariae]|uniref:Uncharacterized protein n=1 Tax=Caenorhabditis auriculariae TaxID=2777116 RepID=A0A8S1HW63_9PELO|nr:unnamed protein product [Caenorhabditis auriculariae]